MSASHFITSGCCGDGPGTRLSHTYVALCWSKGVGSFGYVSSGYHRSPIHSATALSPVVSGSTNVDCELKVVSGPWQSGLQPLGPWPTAGLPRSSHFDGPATHSHSRASTFHEACNAPRAQSAQDVNLARPTCAVDTKERTEGWGAAFGKDFCLAPQHTSRIGAKASEVRRKKVVSPLVVEHGLPFCASAGVEAHWARLHVQILLVELASNSPLGVWSFPLCGSVARSADVVRLTARIVWVNELGHVHRE